MTLPDFLQSVADAIKEKTGKTEKIKPINFPSEIRSISGDGGSGDIIDVETFPTTNVQDDKVYRTEVEHEASYRVWVKSSNEEATGIPTGWFDEWGSANGVATNYYSVENVNSVSNPITTDLEGSPVLSCYIETSTGRAYVYAKDGNETFWVTLGAMFFGGESILDISNDKGFTTNPESETEDGVYVYAVESGEILTGIGIPNANGDKLAFIWNGTEWRKDNIVRVETLPETGETDKLYEIKRNVVEVADIAQLDSDGKWFTYKQLVAAFGGSAIFYTVKELPEKGTYIDNTHVVLYFVVENGKVVQYAEAKEDGSLVIQDLPTDTKLYLSTGKIQNPVVGESYFISNEYTKYEYYGYSNGQWQLLSIPQGTLIVTENGITDCAGYATVNIKSALVQRIASGTVTEITATDSLPEKIRPYAFYGCSQLTTVSFPTNVLFYLEIGSRAFQGCSKLKEINFSDIVHTISDYAFYGCTSLKKIKLPYTEEHWGTGEYYPIIRDYAFANCTSLVEIEFTGTKEEWKFLMEYNNELGYSHENWDLNTGNYIITCTDGTIAKDGTET
jgi:type II secretory pathway pseudopilin PulG